MEVLLVIFIFITVIAAAAVLFVAWACVMIFRGITWLFMPNAKDMPIDPNAVQTCANRHCLGENPGHARFCRKCGKSLPNMLRLAGDVRAA